MARSKSGIERETQNGKPVWRTPSGEVIVLEGQKGKYPSLPVVPPTLSSYGRRARFDCCTDCGASLEEFGALWCKKCRKNHRSTADQAAEANHRSVLMADRTLSKPW